MSQDPRALVWIDLEMTGLYPDRDRIIEMAAIITDSNLEVIAEGPVIAVHQSDELLAGMDEWNTRTHNESGLVERVKSSAHTEQAAEQEMLKFIQMHVPKKKSPLCGNSIGQDRRFLHRYMPRLESWMHYRNLDVSSIKELAGRWRPDIRDRFKKRNTHRAMDDIRESIEELRHYREFFFNLDEEP